MKPCPFQVVFTSASVAALLLLVSCASNPEDEKNTSSAYRHGVPGGTWVESYRIPATVAAIDPATRKVTLVASDGSQNTFTARPDFDGFNQLRVGDHVQAAVARELVVFLPRHGLPPEADTSVARELIKDTEPSGILKADTVEKTARVTDVNPNQNHATIQLEDGTTHNIAARSDVNLRKVKVGEEVVIRTRSAVVLNLEKP